MVEDTDTRGSVGQSEVRGILIPLLTSIVEDKDTEDGVDWMVDSGEWEWEFLKCFKLIST